ncbi:hypothetical protein M3J09_007390 [Ascochyta lentis]
MLRLTEQIMVIKEIWTVPSASMACCHGLDISSGRTIELTFL